MKRIHFLLCALFAAVALTIASPRPGPALTTLLPADQLNLTGWPARWPAQLFERPVVLSWEDAVEAVTRAFSIPKPDRWDGPEDSVYIAPTAEEIQDLLTFIRHRREDLGYIDDANDCDDLATEAKYLATVWSVRHYERLPAALFFGKAYVHISGNYSLLFPRAGNVHIEAYHVLIFFVQSDGRVFFFEPQTDCVAPVESFIYEGSIEVLKLEY